MKPCSTAAGIAAKRPLLRGWLFLLLALAGCAVQAAGRDMLLDACRQPGFATTLQAAASHYDARAYWLDSERLQWPGAPARGRYRLYFSARAQLQAQSGQHVILADPQHDGFLALALDHSALPAPLAQRFKFIGQGVRLRWPDQPPANLATLLQSQLLLVREDANGLVEDSTTIQLPGMLDARYAGAAEANDYGATITGATRFKLWAPTAQAVTLCRYASSRGKAMAATPMQFDPRSGAWTAKLTGDLSGGYYQYLVQIVAGNAGLVVNRVTDPYSISLNTDSQRSYLTRTDAAKLKPPGWDRHTTPERVRTATDMVIYELHVRDFSANDASVPAAQRGKYLAFTSTASNGMQHLAALSRAGLTDLHLLPVFDFAGVPERDCAQPRITSAARAGSLQAQAVTANAKSDCFNWGYEPFHFNAPEGSYSSNSDDGAVRIREFRQMVMALHGIGLRVGMDVVYNHSTAAGQQATAILDRIVPGYYQRLDAAGHVERSTCCANTATEHTMMGKLMIDSAAHWARFYQIDSFRFDLMAHQPRSAMQVLQKAVDSARGRHVALIGEGWNFGEVADGARFVQASQLALQDSGIATFSDRARDAVRGGGPGDSLAELMQRPAYVCGEGDPAQLMQQADLLRVGLAGTLRDYAFLTQDGSIKKASQIDYHGQPAGYASQPGEVVNYVENHDNHTLFDLLALTLPPATSADDRVRIQALALASTAFSQGMAYFHAGVDILRSKSMDRNSFDSGDWFNRLDWTYRDNYFGSGLPPGAYDAADIARLTSALENPRNKPAPAEIARSRDMFRDLLRLRASSSLFRLASREEVLQRLVFYNLGPSQNPALIAGRLDGRDYAGANFMALLYFMNVAATAQTVVIPQEASRHWVLHPLHRAPDAADPLPAAQAKYDAASGSFTIPPRTALVFVEP